MFIKEIKIKNFRLFPADTWFEINTFNVPNEKDEGTGINLFVGENGLGKTTLLDALALPLLSYKAENFTLDDFNDPNKETLIEIFSEHDFEFAGIFPKTKYKAKGFSFEAKLRSRGAKTYLSSTVVNDQKYIKADNQKNPKEESPDLRTNVNNPFIGNRFNENDILFLDRNRIYQIRSGMYSATRFDRLMEDFNYQYIKKENNPFDINNQLQSISDDMENSFLNKAIDKFQEISGIELSVCFLNNWKPYEKAFFSMLKENKQQIPLERLGAGYEMIFSLLYSFFLSKQSNKQLIILIDEPELHLHPKLQGDFVKVLLEFSKSAQIFLTTHSPLLVKQFLYNKKISPHCLVKESEQVKEVGMKDSVLKYLSANEINYIAFRLATEEYHNELYNKLEADFWNDPKNKFETLKKKSYPNNVRRQIVFDNEFFNKQKREPIDSPFKQEKNKVTRHTYIRNKIHHSEENEGFPSHEELGESIKKLRTFF